MTLHIISNNKSDTIQLISDLTCNHDNIPSLLFIESGVYLLDTLDLFKGINNLPCYTLEDHVDGRGVGALVPDYVKKINYADFVALVEKNQSSITW